jgi:hypothetical protein
MNEELAEAAWRESVSAAAIRGDPDALGRLFRDAQRMWGDEAASRLWLETVSAFDANAATG